MDPVKYPDRSIHEFTQTNTHYVCTSLRDTPYNFVLLPKKLVWNTVLNSPFHSSGEQNSTMLCCNIT